MQINGNKQVFGYFIAKITPINFHLLHNIPYKY